MPKILTTALLASSVLASYAFVVDFNYDANGNRIVRELHVDGPLTTNNSKDFFILQSLATDTAIVANVRPNPTHGPIEVSVGGFEPDLQMTFSIISSSGMEIMNGSITSPSSHFSIADNPDGIYFFNLFSNGKRVKCIKIIKI